MNERKTKRLKAKGEFLKFLIKWKQDNAEIGHKRWLKHFKFKLKKKEGNENCERKIFKGKWALPGIFYVYNIYMYIYITVFLISRTSIKASVLSVSSCAPFMFFLIQQIISQFGDRQSDSTRYVYNEFPLYKVYPRTNGRTGSFVYSFYYSISTIALILNFVTQDCTCIYCASCVHFFMIFRTSP